MNRNSLSDAAEYRNAEGEGPVADTAMLYQRLVRSNRCHSFQEEKGTYLRYLPTYRCPIVHASLSVPCPIPWD